MRYAVLFLFSVSAHAEILGVNVHAFLSNKNEPTITQSQAQRSLGQASKIWRQCGISFAMIDYRTDKYRPFNLLTYEHMYTVGQAFDNKINLNWVVTGPWKGDLGATRFDAFSDYRYTVVMEPKGVSSGTLLAHEFGHNLSLGHSKDYGNVMHSAGRSGSPKITAAQCTSAKAAIAGHLKSAVVPE